METAERMFAERGIDAPPLREIAAASGQGNNTAVQYHFGTKEHLVYEILLFRSQQFEPLRVAMIDEASRAGQLSNPRVLLQIMCLPHLTLADNNGAHPYSAFFAQYLSCMRTKGVAHPYDDLTVSLPAMRLTRQLILESLSHIPPEVVRVRFGLTKLMFINMLVRRGGASPHSDWPMSFEELVDDTLDQMTAALTLPYRKADKLFGSLVCDRRWL